MKDITVPNILISDLVDTVIKYNTLEQQYNLIIEDYIIMDSLIYIQIVFNPNDYVTFNDMNTGIEELKSTSVVNFKANIIFMPEDTITNTIYLGYVFNYD